MLRKGGVRRSFNGSSGLRRWRTVEEAATAPASTQSPRPFHLGCAMQGGRQGDAVAATTTQWSVRAPCRGAPIAPEEDQRGGLGGCVTGPVPRCEKMRGGPSLWDG